MLNKIKEEMECYNYIENGSITSVPGFLASGIHCGLKKKRKDLALIYSDKPCVAAGTFTTNLAAAAPVKISQKLIEKNNLINAIIVNSGNANACTGIKGELDAIEVQTECAKALDISPSNVLISSTGVIGEKLNTKAIVYSLSELKNTLSDNGGLLAAEAIMTTDTKAKHFAINVNLSCGNIIIGGIAKGSGMIMPNMATMLGFLTTDAKIEKKVLQSALTQAVNNSFNKISVDGETSTNDMVLMLANQSSHCEIKANTEDYKLFVSALESICTKMAKSIVYDGEGSSKFITINVKEAANENEANKIAKAIANSPLVKTAMNGEDANWGRIISAASTAGVNFNPEEATLSINNISILKPNYTVDFCEENAKKELKKKEIEITLCINKGTTATTWWTCDYSREYININANYRT